MLNERKLTKSEEKRKEELVKRFKKDKRDWVARYGKDAEAAMYGTAVKNAKKQVEAMNNNRIKEAVKAALMQNKKVEENSYMEPEDYDDLMALKDATSIMDNIAELYKQAKKMGYGADVKRMVQDLDEELKGDQKKLDANGDGEISGKDFQILRSKKKKVKEGFYGSSDIEDVTYALGYSDPYKFFEDNPGAIDALMDWIENIPEFRDMLKDADLMEDLDLGHEDNEPHMLKADLYRIGKYAMELYQMVDGFEGKGEVDFPHWWQTMVSAAKDSMVKAKHYLDFETKEPEIDAMVKVIDKSNALDNVGVDEGEVTKVDKLAAAVQKALNAGKISKDEAETFRKMLNKGDLKGVEMAGLEEGLPKGFWKKETAELDEAINKPINQLGPDVDKRMKALGFDTKVFPNVPIPPAATDMVAADPKLAAISFNTTNGVESMRIMVNSSRVRDLQKVRDYFQVPEEPFGPGKQLSWVTKQIQNVNPGDWIATQAGKLGGNVSTIEWYRQRTKGGSTTTDASGTTKINFGQAAESVDESFEKLVGKLEKQGKSKKAATAIAGAVAAYKAKGGGKGPTAKQKK